MKVETVPNSDQSDVDVEDEKPTLDENDDRVEDDANPRPDRIRPVLEWQQVFLALALEACSKAKGCNANGDPTQLVRHANKAT